MSCDRDRFANGYCRGHNNRLYKTGDVQADKPFRKVAKWREGRFMNHHGYVMVWVPPGTPGRNSNGHMMEHRLVMQNHLGRALFPAPVETVHHKNGDRTDNRLENLELRVGNHGIGASAAHCHTCKCFEGTSQ